MSCEDCAKATATRHVATPIRVGTANLDVYGCKEHVQLLIEDLRVASSLTHFFKQVVQK